MDACSRDRQEKLKERVQLLLRRIAAPAALVSRIAKLLRRLDASDASDASEGSCLPELAAELRSLRDASPEVRALLEECDDKDSVDRAEGFLADLAEDRSTAPNEIVPVIDNYIARLREVIARAWDRRISRREVDAHVMQLHLSYSQDLDRILQGLILSPAN